jgi:hypothetical protein
MGIWEQVVGTRCQLLYDKAYIHFYIHFYIFPLLNVSFCTIVFALICFRGLCFLILTRVGIQAPPGCEVPIAALNKHLLDQLGNKYEHTPNCAPKGVPGSGANQDIDIKNAEGRTPLYGTV